MRIGIIEDGMFGMHVFELAMMHEMVMSKPLVATPRQKDPFEIQDFPFTLRNGMIPQSFTSLDFNPMPRPRKYTSKWYKFTIAYKQSRKRKNKQQKLSRRINRLKRK